ncbi:uncharacterized protein BCR38DRAFT_342979, partial [Pseudomassariella vexata]
PYTMDTLRLKPRQPVEEVVEDWDDDDFMIDNDDLEFRNSSVNTSNNFNRRDSRASFKSDRESLGGDDERHLHLPGDDEKSTLDAIAAATNAGIPIPKNVPPSALMGGTIKRLGGKKIKTIFQEDWDEDLELPDNGQTLRIKPRDGSMFPAILRQISSSANGSPVKEFKPAPVQEPLRQNQTMRLASPVNLERYRDNDDDDVFGDDGSTTIKASKIRSISTITPPTPLKTLGKEEDDFETDLELPSSGKLKLSSRKDIPKTPHLSNGDDFDWGEGSLGTRFGGTRRGASHRSSSAMSPSISSSTAESEDDAFDGLVLPNEPLDLGERLKRRKQSGSPERPSDMGKRPRSSRQFETPTTEKEDLFDGLDFGDGDVFSSGKSTLHRNIRVKESRPISPARPKTAVSITFTNKPTPPSISRLPRPMVSHERSHTQSSLEPVSESGGPILPRPSRRSQSRLGHSTQSSVSSVHTPTTPSYGVSIQPSTPRRRELGQKVSTGTLRNEAAATTSAQLLRLKRSLPVMKGPGSPARPVTSRYDRPPSRTDPSRPQSTLRPKTPVDRARNAYEGIAPQARKTPFLPAGASNTQSQHVASKNSRVVRRRDSDQGSEFRPLSRTMSRSTMRSPSPRRPRVVEKVAAEPWQQLNKPRRLRQFGDGHELDVFDDLPTSAHTESKFTKQPIGSGNRTNIRNRLYQNVLPDRNTPSPVIPHTPVKVDHQPHFARDTAASRMAREASLAQRTPPVGPLPTNRVAQLSARPHLNAGQSPPTTIRSRKTRKPQQLKPHLISNLNSGKESKVVNGMIYNPDTFRWEGNENVLNVFDVPLSTPSTASIPYMMREKENTTPRPVLITNMSATKGVKRVGDMVFDPQQMCWLKVDTATSSGRLDDPMDGFDALDDEDDPFRGIPDLEEKDTDSGERTHGRASDVRDDWLVGEEFDVGPEFMRRQREEEERWRKKCEKWIGTVDRDDDAWRWAIRDIVMGS